MKKCWITACIALTVDLLSKWISRNSLKGTVKFGRLLHLRLVENSGIALGMFAGRNLVTLVFPPLMIIVGWLILRNTRINRLGQIGCGLILGGFIGNYIERVFVGHVTDMFFFPWLPFFICNIADIAICFGSAMLLIALLMPSKQKS